MKAGKVAIMKEKEKDTMNKEATILIVVFDLENVTMHNLTAITSKKQGYCTIRTEAMPGRAGNEITSAFICILNKIASDEPHINNITCWSDSCVPQNRKSQISQDILKFLSRQEKNKSIVMKYSLAGHSCVQEVDKMHNQIEDAM